MPYSIFSLKKMSALPDQKKTPHESVMHDLKKCNHILSKLCKVGNISSDIYDIKNNIDALINKCELFYIDSDYSRINKKRKQQQQDSKPLSLIGHEVTTINQQGIFSSPDLPILVTVIHKGFWVTEKDGTHIGVDDINCDKNSVMLANNCLLYVYKLALRHLLLSNKIITPQDIDNGNLVPHIVVRKNKHDPFSTYKSIQGNSFILKEENFSAKSDFLIAELDEKQDLHCTLIYSKKIKQRVDLIQAFKTVIKVLNYYPNLIQEYASLPYFGQAEISYWYDRTVYNPMEVKAPADYQPSVHNACKDVPKVVSAAGSILQDA